MFKKRFDTKWSGFWMVLYVIVRTVGEWFTYLQFYHLSFTYQAPNTSSPPIKFQTSLKYNIPSNISPVAKWFGFWMVVWKPDKKCLFYGIHIQCSNSLPNHMTKPFENQKKVSKKLKVWILGARYSDGNCMCSHLSPSSQSRHGLFRVSRHFALLTKIPV